MAEDPVLQIQKLEQNISKLHLSLEDLDPNGSNYESQLKEVQTQVDQDQNEILLLINDPGVPLNVRNCLMMALGGLAGLESGSSGDVKTSLQQTETWLKVAGTLPAVEPEE